MRKLLTTMSAVAAAMSLYATDSGALSGTSFEGLTAGTYSITAKGSASGGELGEGFIDGTTTYWVTNETATLEIGAYDNVDMTRPEAFDTFQNKSYLSVKTTLGNPVSRYVNSDRSTAVSMSGGLYFDSLVKFTAFDSDPTIELGNDGKLAIWLKEVYGDGENPTGTNLVITAGYVDGNGTATTTNYVSSIINGQDLLNDGGWHRVTVRMIDSIFTSGSTPGFVIAIDEHRVVNGETKFVVPDGNSLTAVAAAFDDEGSLFPSALQSGDKMLVSAVSFDGQGCVDDLVFTRTQPTCVKDPDIFTITIGENVASAKYTLNGSESPITITNETGYGTVSVRVPYASGTYFTISDVILAEGYMEDDPELKGGMSENAGEYLPLANSELVIKAKSLGAYVNGVPYETLTAAIVAANESSSDCTVRLAANAAAGIEIYNLNSGVTITLDLAGNNITAGELDAAAITLMDGTLLVTNSTVTVGEVNGYDGGSALVTAGGTLTIAGGIYNGAVDVSSATSLITGGSFSVNDNKDPDSETLPPAPNGDLAKAVMTGYELEVVSGSSYYTLVEVVTPSTWTVTFLRDDDTTYDEETVDDGDYCTVPETPLKEHYSFLGWFAPGAGVAFDFANTPITGDITVKATYAPEVYTVSFNTAGGSVLPAISDQNVAYNQYATDPEVSPLKEGYEFQYWSADGSTEFDFANTPIVANTTLIAVYTAVNYTVTFDTDGGSVVPAIPDQSVAYNGYATDPNVSPLKEGYQFQYWSADGSTEFVFANTPIVANTTLTAVYQAYGYTITYMYGESTLTGLTPAAYTIEDAVTLPSEVNLGVVGVSFEAWTNAQGEVVANWAAGAKTGNQTFYAKTAAVVPTAIDPEDGTVEVTVTAESEEAAIAGVLVTPPTGSGADAAEYKALFNFTAVETSAGSGEYTVTLTGIKEEVVTGVDTSAVTLLTGSASEGTITVPAGLYYRITPSTALPISGTPVSGLSTGASETVTKPGTTKGFYKIELSAVPFAVPNS